VTTPRTFALRILLTLAVLTLAPTAAPGDEAANPVKGIQTKEFGLGVGYCVPPNLDLVWDGAASVLRFTVKSVNPCPTHPVAGHWLVYGTEFIYEPYALDTSVFLPGSNVYFDGSAALGPFVGNKSEVPIAPSPSLVGQVFLVQGIVSYGGFSPQLGVTEATLVLFVG
jgi:hypothetical protein